MASFNRYTLLPAVVALLFTNIVSAAKPLQNDFLEKLLNQKSGNKVLVVLDNSVLGESREHSRDTAEVDHRGKTQSPFAHLFQLGQSKKKDLDSSLNYYKKLDSRLAKDARIRKLKQREYRNNDRDVDNTDREHRERYHNNRYNQKRDSQSSRFNSYRDSKRDHIRRPRDERSHNRYLRAQTDNQQDRKDQENRDRRDQEDRERLEREDSDRRDREENDRRDREERQRQERGDRDSERDRQQDSSLNSKQRYRSDQSAIAQIPVIKNILRSLNCNARDECENSCNDEPEKNECEDECAVQYECEPEPEEESECDSCTTPKCGRPACTGSTRGERLATEAPTCKRC